jgi:serine/threonine-protein kinase
MSPQRLRQIEECYHATLEHPPEARQRFLEEACGNDAELIREVSSLLAQDDSDNPLESPVDRLAADLLLDASSSRWKTGTLVGPYEILGNIGAGGMGEVYKARDTRLGRTVAVKKANVEFSGRFQREARTISALSHPHICTLHDIGPDYLVMELVEGETLAKRLEKGRLSLDTILEFGAQISSALAAAHAKGIIHRDLKPGNIMLGKGGVKVLDFGLAVFEAGSDSNISDVDTVTAANTILGTPAYMSPEQLEGKRCTPRTDIFALGLILYEMAAGRRAFAGDSRAALTADIMRCQPPALEGLPLAFTRLIDRCLAKDPEDRWQSAHDLAVELGWLQHSGEMPRSREAVFGEARIAIDAPELEVRPRPRPGSRWPWMAAGVAIALAVAAGAGWWRASRAAKPVLPMRLQVEVGSDLKLVRASIGSLLALSPDGTLLAMIVKGSDGVSRVATRRLDEDRVTTLAGTEGANSPVFSPDGQWVAFHSDRKIKKISAGGGAVVTLCDAPGMIAPSWGDDGTIIAALGWGTGLSRIPSSGGQPTPVTELDRAKSEHRHGWPQVLPGSRAVLFSSQRLAENFDDADIDVVSLKTGARTTIHHGGFFARYLPSGHVVWIHQNALYAAPFDLSRLVLTGEPRPVVDDIGNGMDTGGDFAFSRDGLFVYNSGKREPPRSIFWLESTGRTQPLHPAPGLYGFPRFSPDGKRLAFSSADGHGHVEIWVRDLNRGTESRVTGLPDPDETPVWTPDSQNLVLWSSNPTAPGIYLIRADGSAVAQRLTEDNIVRTPGSISSDGKRLAMIQASSGAAVEIWTAPFEGDAGHPRLGRAEPFLQSRFNTISPSFSPDGRWLAYSTSEPGKKGLWVVPFPGPGSGWLVSSSGGYPIWSRNSSDLFFVAGGRTIMVVDYKARGDALEFGEPRVWTPHSLLDLGSPPVVTFDLAPDGKRFAVVLNADGTADPLPITHLTFLLNFFDDLRRRVPTDK